MCRGASVRLVMLLACAAALAVPAAATAQPPSTYPVQGYLTDADGNPVDGARQLRIRLYADADGTALVHEETQSVEVKQGRFTVVLGTVAPLDPSVFAGSDQPLWMGVTVGDEEEMRPLLPLGTVPYAAACADAQRLGGETADELVARATAEALPRTGGAVTGNLRVEGTVMPNAVGGPAFNGSTGARFQWGEVDIPGFMSITCTEVAFDSAYTARPVVWVSTTHWRTMSRPSTSFHEAVTTWVEWVDENGFYVCVKEVDGNDSHDQVSISWLAIGT